MRASSRRASRIRAATPWARVLGISEGAVCRRQAWERFARSRSCGRRRPRARRPPALQETRVAPRASGWRSEPPTAPPEERPTAGSPPNWADLARRGLLARGSPQTGGGRHRVSSAALPTHGAPDLRARRPGLERDQRPISDRESLLGGRRALPRPRRTAILFAPSLARALPRASPGQPLRAVRAACDQGPPDCFQEPPPGGPRKPFED